MQVVPAFIVSTWWQVVGLSGVVLSFGRVFPAFYPLCRSSLGALLADMALFRVFRAFLAGFMGFVWVCVALVLCVDCGAFVRVCS